MNFLGSQSFFAPTASVHRLGGRAGSAPSSGSVYGSRVAQAQSSSASGSDFGRVASEALGAAGSAASWLQQFMNAEMFRSLDRLYPRWRQDIVGAGGDAQRSVTGIAKQFTSNVLPKAMAAANQQGTQMLKNLGAMLQGDLPPDVEAQVRRRAAETAQHIGARGQAEQFLTARDLGRTSLDMMVAGQQMAADVHGFLPQAYLQFGQTATMPIQSGTALTNMLQPFMPKQIDAGQLYSQHLGVGAQMATHQSSLGVESARLAQNQSQFDTQARSNEFWNQINWASQQRAIQNVQTTVPQQTNPYAG
jgi:hypothetical protein